MNTRTEDILNNLAVILLILTPMLDPRISVCLSLVLALGLGAYYLSQKS